MGEKGVRLVRKGIPAMPIKYHCPNCGKRYVEWGAEKLGFKCPECEGEELIRMGLPSDRPARRPSLKRILRKAAPVPHEELPEALPDEVEEAEEVEEVEIAQKAVVAVEGEDGEGFVPDAEELVAQEPTGEVELDVSEGLDFAESSPAISEEPGDESELSNNDWRA